MQVQMQRRRARLRTDEPSVSSRTATPSDTTAADLILDQIDAVLSEA